MSKSILPASKKRIGTFNTLADENREILQEILENDYKSDDDYTTLEQSYDQQTFSKIQAIYKSCMNMESIKNAGNKPLISYLRSQLIPSLSGSSWNPQEALGTSHRLLVHIFFTTKIEVDLKENDKHRIMITQGGLNLPSLHYYEEPRTMQIYRDVMKDALSKVLPHIGQESVDLDEVVDGIIRLEQRIAKISATP